MKPSLNKSTIASFKPNTKAPFPTATYMLLFIVTGGIVGTLCMAAAVAGGLHSAHAENCPLAEDD